MIAPGDHAVLYLWFAVERVPRLLRHRLAGTIEGDSEMLGLEVDGAIVGGRPLRLRPPLRGDGWVAANGPANDTHHRRSWLAVSGRAAIPQRFAIDFVRSNDDGSLFKGDAKKNENYRGYGAEVYAVAKGIVDSIKDGISDNVPPEAPRTITALESAGNYVSLKVGAGRYVFYAHLKPGSIRVKPGDRVRTGQLLGQAGNSGNSTAPHLHFQVSTLPTMLLGDGLPFVFDAFRRNGVWHRDEIPLKDWVVAFSP